MPSMPMTVPIGTLKITQVVSDNQGRTFGNVFWWTQSAVPAGTPDDFTKQAIQDWQTIMDPLYSAAMTTATHGLLTIATYYSSFGSFKEIKGTPAIVGTVTGDECPAFVAACVQKRTATPGPRNRGRWYFGPVPESLTDESFLDDLAPYTAIAQAVCATFTFGGTDFAPQLFSRKDNTLKPIIGYVVDGVLATQRRRRLRY